MTTPPWKSADNGLPSNLNATNHAAQVNQLLGTHGITPIYEGNQLVTPSGGANFTWLSYGNTTDLDQPFTMPAGHTTIGRVTIPVQPVGNGADLMVILCPDSGSGTPNTSNPLAATTIPAAWTNQLGAPNGIESGGPLALARFNTLYMTGGFVRTPWSPPTGGNYGSATLASTCSSGNYIITAGGADQVHSVAVNSVVTSQYTGGGVEQLSIPQPSVPVASYSAALAANSSTVIYAGGSTVVSGAQDSLTSVWTASWNSSTGVMGSWSQQTALPQTITQASATIFNNFAYVIGGINTTPDAILNTVYYASITNGQVGSWISGQPLPVALYQPIVNSLNGWLIVAGGFSGFGGPISSAVYYAKIQPDGSLGSWKTGPSLPTAVAAYNPGWDTAVTDNQLAIFIGATSGSSTTDAVQILSVDTNGPADQWYSTHWSHNSAEQYGVFPRGNGAWDVIGLNFPNNYYEYTVLTPVPIVSVPLAAAGLTGGATYHLVLQQHQTASASDYLNYGINSASLPTDALKSSRHSGTWATAQTGYSMPITVYDNTPGGPILHTWEDPSSTGNPATSNIAARTSTLVYGQQNLLIGACEATQRPNDPLNSNPTFTSGTSPWTTHGCTLTQSSAQTHGGFPFSGLITPDGVTSGPYVDSELVPIYSGTAVTNPAQYYLVSGWMYSPTGYSQVSLSINWFDSAQGFLSNTFSGVTIAANTWTLFSNAFLAPATATYAAINPTLTGTPTTSNLLYLSNLTIASSPEVATMFADVAQITYPQGALWPPTGIVQLA